MDQKSELKEDVSRARSQILENLQATQDSVQGAKERFSQAASQGLPHFGAMSRPDLEHATQSLLQDLKKVNFINVRMATTQNMARIVRLGPPSAGDIRESVRKKKPPKPFLAPPEASFKLKNNSSVDKESEDKGSEGQKRASRSSVSGCGHRRNRRH